MVFSRSAPFAPALLIAALTIASASAEPVRTYRYSVINQTGQVFSMTLKPVTRSMERPGVPQEEVIVPTAKGQRVLESPLRTAGVYDRPAGPSVPLSGRNPSPHTGPVGVTIHYN